MKNLRIFIYTIITFMFFSINVFAIEGDEYELYEMGNDSIETKELIEYENNLIEKVEKLNKSSDNLFGIHYLYLYRYRLNTINTEKILESEFIRNIIVDKTFMTKKEAIKYYDTIVLEGSMCKGQYTIKTNINTYEDAKENELVCSSLDCNDELTNLKNDLKSNQRLESSIVFDKSKEVTKYVDYKENDQIKYFDSDIEALNFAKEFIPTLEGWSFVKNNIELTPINVLVSKSYSELYDVDTFDFEKVAQDKLLEFQQKYNTSNGTVETIRNQEKDIVSDIITLEEVFNSKEKAENKVNELVRDTKTEIVSANVREGEKSESTLIEEEFDSKESAELEIEKLQKEGYIIDNYSIVGKLTVNSNLTGNKYDYQSDKYEFSKDITNYVLIKQASGKVVVWTEYEIVNKEDFVEAYNKGNNFDGSTRNLEIENVYFIYGYKSFDLTILNSNGKNGPWANKYEFKLSEDNSKILLLIPSKAISHAVYGNISIKEEKYMLTGSKYLVNWYVDYQVTTKGYDYKINANVMIEDVQNKYKVVSVFKNEEKIAKLKYIIYTEMEEVNYSLSYEECNCIEKEFSNIEWLIERTKLGFGGDIPPKTGITIDNKNNNIYIVTLISMLLIIIKKIIK